MLSLVFGVIKWLQEIGPAQISWKGDEKHSQQTWAFVTVCMLPCWERQIKLLLLAFNPCNACAADHELFL